MEALLKLELSMPYAIGKPITHMVFIYLFLFFMYFGWSVLYDFQNYKPPKVFSRGFTVSDFCEFSDKLVVWG